MKTLLISVFDVLDVRSRDTLIEYANYIADRNAISHFYLLKRRIKELKRMCDVAPDKRTKLCWQQDVLLLQAIEYRLGVLELQKLKEVVNNGRA